MNCRETVFDSHWPRKCGRNAVRDGYCAQHHPDAVAERQRQNAERAQVKMAEEELQRVKRAVKLLEAKGYKVIPPEGGAA